MINIYSNDNSNDNDDNNNNDDDQVIRRLYSESGICGSRITDL